MNRLPISAVAAALLRALIARSGAQRDRILLTEAQSIDWHSLTFVGERHQLHLRVTGPNSTAIVAQICGDLEDAEFRIPGQIVADIAMIGEPSHSADGSASLLIEALTVED